MSLTATNIFAEILRTTKANNSSYPLAQRVLDVNLAQDRFLALALTASGSWQVDDTTHTDYPIILGDLTAGKRDYVFTTDEQGNIILGIYRVFIKNPDGIYVEIYPFDVQTGRNTEGFTDGQNLQGTPYRYDKTANGLFLDPVPDYSATNGVKIYISRESYYFTVSDTTRKPGFPGIFHDYFVLYPSYKYARDNSLDNVSLLHRDLLAMEDAIIEHYDQREGDVRPRIKPSSIQFR